MSLSASSLWSPISGGITAPHGFKASGVRAGFKISDKPDLALLLAPQGSICAGTFTQSLMRASCIDLAIERLRVTNGQIRAVLVNSGHANACTGPRGLLDSLHATKQIASCLGLLPDEVLICSTGLIGAPIPMRKLLDAIEPLASSLSDEGGSAAAQAILTTDLVVKEIALQAEFGGRKVRIGGMAKGSGMIHPNMATMLGYFTCDVGVASDLWQGMIKRVVERSFNVISIDGDTSTNDACLAFNAGDHLENEYLNSLEIGLNIAAQYLAKAIARDGEGAYCLLEVKVVGTQSDVEANQLARSIVGSSLVKTAVHGCDPNWGRIVAAAGRSGVTFNPDNLSIWLGPYQLMKGGQSIEFDHSKVSTYMKKAHQGNYLSTDCVCIRLLVGSGPGAGKAWGCDLSDEYVRINADYTT